MNEKENKCIQQMYIDAKSIHVFACPFIWIKENSKIGLKTLLEDRSWQKKSLDYNDYPKNSDAMRETYMYEKYLSYEAQRIWENEKTDVSSAECTVYEQLNTQEWDFSYIIRTKDNEYKLLIDSFELHIYSNDTGILFIKALNMDNQTTINDIKCINNQGRCISLPFLPADNNDYIECPEQLGISYIDENGKRIEQLVNYREKANSILTKKPETDISIDFLSQIINWNFTILNENKEKPSIKYRTINDHRMFVMGLIVDDNVANDMKNLQQENETLEESWYSVLHIDTDTASCQHTKMRRELLERETYPRWNGFGTVYGATQYSFITITGVNDICKNTVVRPFYKEYIYMVSLVLAQKVGLMKFSEEAEKLANDMNKKKKEKELIELKLCQTLIDLQENYIAWKNKMLIPEFSNQEQSVELYQLMQEQFLVNKKKEMLDEQLKGMYEVVTISNGSRDSKDSLTVAIVALIISLLSIDDFLLLRSIAETIFGLFVK